MRDEWPIAPQRRPHYRFDRALEAAAPVTAHTALEVPCSVCSAPVRLDGGERPGTIARALAAGLMARGRLSGVVCEKCEAPE